MPTIHQVIPKYFLAATLLAASHMSIAAWEFNHDRMPIWIKSDSAPAQSIFDDQTVRFLAKHSAPWVVLHTFINGDEPKYNTVAIVDRFRSYNPAIKVLGYAWINVFNSGTSAGLISMTTLDGYADLDPSLIITVSEGKYYGDLSVPEFRDWIFDKIVAARNAYNLDGFAIDAANRDPWRYEPLRAKAESDPVWSEAYKAGMEELIARLAAQMDIMFNTVYYKEPGSDLNQFNSQLTLHEQTNVGASTEFWGGYAGGHRNSFSELITMADAWRLKVSYPQSFFIHGRPPVIDYQGYAASINDQRYLYGSYLLGALPNTYYNFIGAYPIPWKPIYGRGHTFTPLADTTWDLGKAQSAYYVDGYGCYQRKWDKGKVVVHPHDSSGPSYVDWFTPNATYYLSDNTEVSSTSPLRLQKGQAAIVFNAGDLPPILNTGRLITFNEVDHPAGEWNGAAISTGGNDKYLHLTTVPNRGEHDYLLFPILHQNYPGSFTVRYRTSSNNAKVLVVAEVNDKTQQDDLHTVFELAVNPGSAREFNRPFYRQHAYSGDKISWAPVSNLVADGEWHTLTFYANTELNNDFPGRYTYIRYHFVRFEGDIDIDEIKIGDAPYLTDTDLFY